MEFLTLALMREYCGDSLVFKDYLPLDMFRIIFKQIQLLKDIIIITKKEFSQKYQAHKSITVGFICPQCQYPIFRKRYPERRNIGDHIMNCPVCDGFYLGHCGDCMKLISDLNEINEIKQKIECITFIKNYQMYSMHESDYNCELNDLIFYKVKPAAITTLYTHVLNEYILRGGAFGSVSGCCNMAKSIHKYKKIITNHDINIQKYITRITNGNFSNPKIIQPICTDKLITMGWQCNKFKGYCSGCLKLYKKTNLC